jgi:hypothetical protein
MDHNEWSARIRRAVRAEKAEGLEVAISWLDKLAQATRREARDQANYRYAQTLGLKAILLEKAGRLEEAARVTARLVRYHRSMLNYHSRGIANALARVALQRFREGRARQGERLTKEAMIWAARFGEISATISEAEQRLVGYYKSRASSAGSKR